MKDYTSITAESISRLDRKVNDKLSEGYLLTGGMCYLPEIDKYCQAVYKPSEEKKIPYRSDTGGGYVTELP